jgi:hypothetical protein
VSEATAYHHAPRASTLTSPGRDLRDVLAVHVQQPGKEVVV